MVIVVVTARVGQREGGRARLRVRGGIKGNVGAASGNKRIIDAKAEKVSVSMIELAWRPPVKIILIFTVGGEQRVYGTAEYQARRPCENL